MLISTQFLIGVRALHSYHYRHLEMLHQQYASKHRCILKSTFHDLHLNAQRDICISLQRFNPCTSTVSLFVPDSRHSLRETNS